MIEPGQLLAAVRARDDELVWRLCVDDYGNLAIKNPRMLWTEVSDCILIANDEALAAIATCLLEHMLETDFEYFVKLIAASIDADDRKMAACFMICSKFGQSKLPNNSAQFDILQERAHRLL